MIYNFLQQCDALLPLLSQWIDITLKMQRKQAANFCVLMRLYKSRQRAKYIFSN